MRAGRPHVSASREVEGLAAQQPDRRVHQRENHTSVSSDPCHNLGYNGSDGQTLGTVKFNESNCNSS